jgi:hypothetical protein
MLSLLADVLDAHGGLARWNSHRRVAATIVTGGGLWALKGLVQDAAPRRMRVDLHSEWASVSAYGAPGRCTEFTPGRIAIMSPAGAVIAERAEPRASFAGHGFHTPWDTLHRAYFNGYALWTYLTSPFCLALPGVENREIAPWTEGAERWRGLRATFPDGIASHSREQDFYVGPDLLLRRHDYVLDIAGGVAAAQYISDPVEVDGITMFGRRRAYRRGEGLAALRDDLLVAIDLADFHFEES